MARFGEQSFQNHFNLHVAKKPNPAEKSEAGLDSQKFKDYDASEEIIDKEPTAEKYGEKFLRQNLLEGNHEDILKFIETESKHAEFFKGEVAFIKKTSELETADFLTGLDWKLLTCIELKDRKTFEHSVGTFIIVKDKIEKKLPELMEWVKQENITPEELYRACLLHDIGKLGIPDLVLKNTTRESGWARIFARLSSKKRQELIEVNKLEIPKGIQNNPGEIAIFFNDQRILASKFVPFEKVLSKNKQEKTEQIEKLKSLGVNPSLPIGKIMESHEQLSAEILEKLGLEKEAVLAGSHHNYKKTHSTENIYPSSHSSLHIGSEFASQIIHLGDVQQALESNRYYHMKKPRLKIMAFLIDHADKGLIDPAVTAMWIKDEMEGMNPGYIEEIKEERADHQTSEYTKSRKRELELIEDFLEEYLPTEEIEYKLAA